MPRRESKEEIFMKSYDDTILLPEAIPIHSLKEGKRKALVSMLRLDIVHPVVSGNKLFKLYYYLQDVLQTKHKTLLTFGGAFSNHLAATAYICNKLGIKSIGVVRGTQNEGNSSTLRFCIRMGMKLNFVLGDTFRKIGESEQIDTSSYCNGECVVVPMGGYSMTGARGASEILRYIPKGIYSHICVSIGTATTLAGLLRNDREEQLVGFPALKGLNDIDKRLEHLGIKDHRRLSIESEFHFGGFAKKDSSLIGFMNNFYKEFKIPLDFVYTGKMMYGIFHLMDKGFFPEGSNVLAIHTGGLQGNQSLAEGVLCYFA